VKDLLDRLLQTHSPGGLEREIDEVIETHLQRHVEKVHRDSCGNLYIQFPGKTPGPSTLISAHKDELSLVVRKIDEDGKVWLDPIGGLAPFKYGEGPFDLITADGIVEGVLCMGSIHTSELSARIHKAKNEKLTWDMVYLDCKLDQKQLGARGVMVGDRAVIGRRRKKPLFLQDKYVCGYAIDDKGAVAILLALADLLRESRPLHDVCLAFTTQEEIGSSGALYLSRKLQPDNFIALEIAPVAEEYPIKFNEQPVVVFKDAVFPYSTDFSREVVAAGKLHKIDCQSVVYRNYGTDASVALRHGLTCRSACLGFPTENTHGYEMASLAAMNNCLRLLSGYLTRAIA
jgi:putative aminopeptidase FrvX